MVFAFSLPLLAQEGEGGGEGEKKPAPEKKPEAAPEKKPEGEPEKKPEAQPERPGERRRGREGREGRRERRMRRGFPMRELQEQLGLSEQQMEKVREIWQNLFQEMMESFRGGGGGFDRQAMRQRRQQLMEKLQKQVRDILTEEQKVKYDKFVKELQERGRRFGRGRFRDPARRKQQQIRRAKEALKLDPEEEKVIMPLVEGVIDAQNKLRGRDVMREQQDALRKALDEQGTSAEVIKEKLDALRNARKEAEQALKEAEETLREVLTIQQEARLVSLGILR
jgi:hypothetical protein